MIMLTNVGVRYVLKTWAHLLSSQEGIWNVSILFFSKKDIISFGGLIWPWSEQWSWSNSNS